MLFLFEKIDRWNWKLIEVFQDDVCKILLKSPTNIRKFQRHFRSFFDQSMRLWIHP